MNEPAIKINSVTKKFKDVTAVNDLSVEIQKGEYIALLGPNGAGKTTLVEMIEGVQKPDSGKITLLGLNWTDHEKILKEKLGFSFQETHFIERLTVMETVKLFASFYGKDKQKIENVIEIVGLTEKISAYTSHLSGGQRQKLALAVALLCDPEILILDEPTTGLDPGARRDIWNVLQTLKEKNTTLILTTHYMEEAEFLCEKIIMLDKGKILAQGSLAELIAKFDLGEIIEFSLGQNPKKTNWKFTGMKNFNYDVNTKKGRIVVEDVVRTVPQFMEKVNKEKLSLKEFECRKMTLDDLFLSMTGRKLDE